MNPCGCKLHTHNKFNKFNRGSTNTAVSLTGILHQRQTNTSWTDTWKCPWLKEKITIQIVEKSPFFQPILCSDLCSRFVKFYSEKILTPSSNSYIESLIRTILPVVTTYTPTTLSSLFETITMKNKPTTFLLNPFLQKSLILVSHPRSWNTQMQFHSERNIIVVRICWKITGQSLVCLFCQRWWIE